MQKTKWREQIDQLEVGESVEVAPTMKESSFRVYLQGQIKRLTGRKFSINKLNNNTFKVTRTV